MKYNERTCKFNMDTGCVELLLRDGAFLYIGKNERRIAENKTNFYSARCFAR